MENSNISAKWRNITISGRVASGATTLFNKLRQELAPQGWKFFSGGEFMREYAIKHNLISSEDTSHHKATVYSDEFDIEVDGMMKKRLSEEENLVIEADLAGFNAKGIDGVLKILLICDDALLIDRIVNRDNVTIEEAKKHIREREEENIKKWRRLYGEYDFWDLKYYDLVIDTYKNSPQETVDLVFRSLEGKL